MHSILQDLRYAVRTLAKRPGFSAAAVGTLALGIGANTAIFSVINGVLIQPLPYQQDSQLMLLRQTRPGTSNTGFSPQELDDLRAGSGAFADFVEYHSLNFTLLGRGEPVRVRSGVVSWQFFQMLGVGPQLGRLFDPDDDVPNAEPVLLLSYRFWQGHFGADPTVVGQTVRMNDKVHTIVGVLPPFPHYPRENDVYMPTVACPFRPNWIPNRNARALTVFGRAKDGMTPELAATDLTAVANHMRADFPEFYPTAAESHEVAPIRLKAQLTDGARPTLLILMGTVGLVLLIACANVANLTLARLFHREREMAVRAAIGAGKSRLMRQLVTESMLLALAGGAVGTVFAWGGLDLLVGFTARFTPRAGEVALDGAVFLFTLGVATITGLAFGLLPAFPSRPDLSVALRDAGARSGAGSTKHLVRNGLVISQLAFSFMLLIGAGLAIRSFAKLQGVDAGVESRNVLTMTLAAAFNTTVDPLAFSESLLEEVAAVAGVESVALTTSFPLDGVSPFSNTFDIVGRASVDTTQRPTADFRVVSPAYFATVGQGIVRGRTFRLSERGPETPPVAVVNRSFVAEFFRNDDPIGSRIQTSFFGLGDRTVQIVGVAGDVKQRLDQPPKPEIYFNKLQLASPFSRLLVRTAGEPLAITEPIRRIVRELAPDVPLADVRTLAEVRSESIASPRVTALLLGIFAAVALVISATGIVGVIGFSVSQRNREIGLRMALGADKEGVLRMIMKQGMVMVGLGLAAGLGGALALTRLMSGILFELDATDPVTYVGVALVLAGAAAAATFVPARRAASIDPMVALRSE